jgi:hypothetical protein
MPSADLVIDTGRVTTDRGALDPGLHARPDAPLGAAGFFSHLSADPCESRGPDSDEHFWFALGTCFRKYLRGERSSKAASLGPGFRRDDTEV